MTGVSPLQTFHKKGLFGYHHKKNQNNLVKKISILNGKLKNKSFLDNAPTLIVQKEKKSLINSNIELKKLNSILNSIKN